MTGLNELEDLINAGTPTGNEEELDNEATEGDEAGDVEELGEENEAIEEEIGELAPDEDFPVGEKDAENPEAAEIDIGEEDKDVVEEPEEGDAEEEREPIEEEEYGFYDYGIDERQDPELIMAEAGVDIPEEVPEETTSNVTSMLSAKESTQRGSKRPLPPPSEGDTDNVIDEDMLEVDGIQTHVIVGTCQTMCPLPEIDDRIQSKEVSVFETVSYFLFKQF